MIEISHKHARRLLREELDRHLPNDQWPVLQAHLENCSACREYQSRLSRMEKDLRRVLRSGWESIRGPEQSVTREVIDRRGRRLLQRKQVFSSVTVFSIVALFFILGGPGWLNGLLHPSAPLPVTGADITPTLTATMAPTAEAGIFPGIVVYAARHDGRADGDSEIYLVNVGTDPVNLTNNPADDTDPAWSPDGEWIAFLSNRKSSVAPNGDATQNTKPKSELYVTNITGNRVVQLTANPGIIWQGPLSWSPDGKEIALTGTRASEDGKRWIYVVSLDGSGSRLLQESMGGWAPKFSPTGDKLAFSFSDRNTAGVMVFQLDDGTHASSTWASNTFAPDSLGTALLDWSLDGAAIAFVAGNSTRSSAAVQSQVVAAGGFNSSITLPPDIQNDFLIASSEQSGAFGGVTWAPGGTVVFLENSSFPTADGSDGPAPAGCWTIQVHSPGLRNFSADSNSRGNPSARNNTQITNLCVMGGLDRGSWTADYRWLVVLAQFPNHSQNGVYAIRMPDRAYGSRRATPTPSPNVIMPEPGDAFQLAAGPFFQSVPRVRPGQRFFSRSGPLNINPRQVTQESNVPAPLNSGTLTGDLPW